MRTEIRRIDTRAICQSPPDGLFWLRSPLRLLCFGAGAALPDCTMPLCLASDVSGSCHFRSIISRSISRGQSRPRRNGSPGKPSRAAHGSCRSH